MIKILKEPLYREKFAYWSFCFLFFCSCAKDREQKLPHIFLDTTLCIQRAT